MRPFAKTLLNFYNAIVDDRGPSMGDLQVIQQKLMRFYNDALEELPFEQRPADTSILNQELSYFMHYAAFEHAGRNIFDFSPAIATLFRETDVDDVPISSIQLPYRSSYLWFGAQQDLDLWSGGYFVDGAYVAKNFEQLDIVLSIVRSDVDYSRAGFLSARDRYYYFYVPLGDEAKTIGDALKSVIEKDKPFEPKIHEDVSGEYEIDGQRVQLQDVHRQTAVTAAAEKRTGYSTFADALRLIINGLCFLTAYSDDVERRYGDDVPAALLEKLKRSMTAKERRRSESKLASMGYTRIHFCGRAFEKLGATPTKAEVTPHWRRGHWRHQSFGPKQVQRKLVWIMPTIVRRDKGMPEHGHIYLIDPE